MQSMPFLSVFCHHFQSIRYFRWSIGTNLLITRASHFSWRGLLSPSLSLSLSLSHTHTHTHTHTHIYIYIYMCIYIYIYIHDFFTSFIYIYTIHVTHMDCNQMKPIFKNRYHWGSLNFSICVAVLGLYR